MKRLIGLFCLAACAVVAGSCSKEKVIPDSVLAEIFRDAYLTNAYIDEHQIRFDSLEIYEPIFERYGYTAENFRYTIGSFSRRKSANLSDVVERAIAMLENEGAYYKREVAVLDTIDDVARRRYTRSFYADSLIRVRRLSDTADLRIRLEDIRPGEYNISYAYLIDSLDENRILRTKLWLEGDSDTVRGDEYTMTLRKLRRSDISRTLRADTSMRALVLNLYQANGALKRPDVTIYDLRVTCTPEVETAVDSLYREQLNLRIFADEYFPVLAPDSLELPLHGK